MSMSIGASTSIVSREVEVVGALSVRCFLREVAYTVKLLMCDEDLISSPCSPESNYSTASYWKPRK